MLSVSYLYKLQKVKTNIAYVVGGKYFCKLVFVVEEVIFKPVREFSVYGASTNSRRES